MARGRQAGVKNRNYPPLPLSKALRVPRTIEHEASGMTVSRLTVAELLDTTPTSRVFKDLVASARFYGLTEGGINATNFSVTERGQKAVQDDDEEERAAALKEAVLSAPPYKTFFETFQGRKMPGKNPMREFLTRDANVEPDRTEEVIAYITDDAKTAGLVKRVKNADWIDSSGIPAPVTEDEEDEADASEEEASTNGKVTEPITLDAGDEKQEKEPAKVKSRPNAIFVGHGKNKKPRDQLTKILGQYGIPFKVAEEEPHRGRPIPIKVKETMEECGAAILIFSADEELFDSEHNSVWRPSENVVHELGAASVMYDSRIIVFREEAVNLATNYESIGYITFEKDDLTGKANDLFRELIALGILKVSVSD